MPNPLYGSPTKAAQPPPKIIDNPPAKSVSAALSNSAKQVNKAK
jgi:hypothetical protein